MSASGGGKVTMTRLELLTIIEDAFIDGWKTHDNDWVGPEAYLEKHKEYNESSETTIAIDDLKEEMAKHGSN